MLQTDDRLPAVGPIVQTATMQKTPFAIQELLGLTNDPEMGQQGHKGGAGGGEGTPPFTGYPPRPVSMLHSTSMADQFSLTQAFVVNKKFLDHVFYLLYVRYKPYPII